MTTRLNTLEKAHARLDKIFDKLEAINGVLATVHQRCCQQTDFMHTLGGVINTHTRAIDELRREVAHVNEGIVIIDRKRFEKKRKKK